MKADVVQRRLIPIALSCAFLVASICAERADAAVRLCKAHVTSEVISAETERDAKRQALKDWVKKAKAAGLAHPSWRLASYKVLKCVPRSGLFQCVAHGAPCTIKQKAPPRRKKDNPRSSTAGEGVDT